MCYDGGQGLRLTALVGSRLQRRFGLGLGSRNSCGFALGFRSHIGFGLSALLSSGTRLQRSGSCLFGCIAFTNPDCEIAVFSLTFGCGKPCRFFRGDALLQCRFRALLFHDPQLCRSNGLGIGLRPLFGSNSQCAFSVDVTQSGLRSFPISLGPCTGKR